MIKDNPFCVCCVDEKNNFVGFLSHKNMQILNKKIEKKRIEGLKKYGVIFKVTTWKKTFF